jgi:flagellar hook-length control protein FliK
MASGNGLPIIAAAPAEVAGSAAGRGSGTAAETGAGGGGGFGAVLDARLEALIAEQGSVDPELDRTIAAAAADLLPVVDGAALDPALAALLAAQSGAAAGFAAYGLAAPSGERQTATGTGIGGGRVAPGLVIGSSGADRAADALRLDAAVPLRSFSFDAGGTQADTAFDAGHLAWMTAAEALASSGDGDADGGPTPITATGATDPNLATAAIDARREVTRAALPRSEIGMPVGNAGWGATLAERVTWIAHARQPGAELQINPPHLGPLEVRISVGADQQTSLTFFSPHAGVREAVQAALPRLHDAFAAGGLTLGQVSVGAESFAGQWQGRQGESGGGERSAAARDLDAAGRVIGETRLGTSGWAGGALSLRAVDLFA